MKSIFALLFIVTNLSGSHSDVPLNQSQAHSSEVHKIFDQTVRRMAYLGVGATFGGLTGLAHLGTQLGEFLPKNHFLKKDCFLLQRLCSSVARHAFNHAISTKAFTKSSTSWWQENQQLLAEIPTKTADDAKLLHFLEERWLAKVASFSALALDWAYPCFGICYPVHPDATHSYARSLIPRFCAAYTKRANNWKKSLPHPEHFPLILTRSTNVQSYFPSHVELCELGQIKEIVTKIGTDEIFLDTTPLFSKDLTNWMEEWNLFQRAIRQACFESQVDPNQIVCLQTVTQESIGGIRILPLEGQSTEQLEIHHQHVLECLSGCGLAPSRVELDRWPLSHPFYPRISLKKTDHSLKQDLVALNLSIALLRYDQKWIEAPPHKSVMLDGTLRVLESLLAEVSHEKWETIVKSETLLAITQSEIAKIATSLDLLVERSNIPFLDFTACLETIHADISSLLEIFIPFVPEHFSPIYRDLLFSFPPMPQELKALTTCGIHTSGMTNLAAIVKAVGKKPYVLYGENTYFECVNALQRVSHASSLQKATPEEWKRVELIVEQFNPVLRLGEDVEYDLEKISENLHKCLRLREGAPLVLALDCTIDYLHSQKIALLLQEFQPQITSGALNVIGFRSGNKFDLFGMDNYCGAPIFMIHNADEKWNRFSSLYTDENVQADLLSANWFCLAYKNVAPQLDVYRKMIFDNTRNLLERVPSSLIENGAKIRVSPASGKADLAFIDIKTSGFLHKWRSSALVAGLLYITSMEEGRPMFNRPSLGFYHSNCTMHFGDENSTIRLTLGIDPADVDLFARCLERFTGFDFFVG